MPIDTGALFPFDARVVRIPLLAAFCLALTACAGTPPKPYQVENPKTLPVALDPNFELRKAQQYFLDPAPKQLTGQINPAVIF